MYSREPVSLLWLHGMRCTMHRPRCYNYSKRHFEAYYNKRTPKMKELRFRIRDGTKILDSPSRHTRSRTKLIITFDNRVRALNMQCVHLSLTGSGNSTC